MIIIDDIAYADNASSCLSVKKVRTLEDFKLLLTFSNGEEKLFDFEPLLEYPAFRPLRDKALFHQAYVDFGAVTWNDEIDIAPEALYEHGVPVA